MSLELAREQSASLLISESSSPVDGHGASAINSPRKRKACLSTQSCLTALLAISNIFLLVLVLHLRGERIPDNLSPYGTCLSIPCTHSQYPII
jgi:hypothetical protein